MKRKLSVLLVFVLLICALPVTVFANSPAPFPWYWFKLTNLPEGTQYVDMLIKLPEEDSRYAPLVSDNLPDTFATDAPIVNYCERDFRSYTFHYQNAKSMIHVDSDNAVFFFTDSRDNYPLWEHEQDIYDRGRIRLAMLDEQGNILKVSRSFSVTRESIFCDLGHTFHYDGDRDSLERDARLDVIGVLLYLLISVAGLLLTCFAESLISTFFGLYRGYGKLILWTNVVSQILMRVAHVLLYGWIFAHYTWLVAFLELTVYTGEYFWYRSRMKDLPGSHVLWFTVTANTASLLLSIFPLFLV